jgi:hypothetical protein
MEDTMEVQDFVITDTWIDKKTGEEVSNIRKIGVSFKMKGGGWRHKLYRNVSVGGEAMSLPQRKKGGGEAANGQEIDTGDDFCE